MLCNKTDAYGPLIRCGLQLAYQTATGMRKQRTMQMEAGGQIHEALEALVVEKVEVELTSREDGIAAQVGALTWSPS